MNTTVTYHASAARAIAAIYYYARSRAESLCWNFFMFMIREKYFFSGWKWRRLIITPGRVFAQIRFLRPGPRHNRCLHHWIVIRCWGGACCRNELLLFYVIARRAVPAPAPVLSSPQVPIGNSWDGAPHKITDLPAKRHAWFAYGVDPFGIGRIV